jgi:outer membrane protein assembly factor BamB
MRTKPTIAVILLYCMPIIQFSQASEYLGNNQRSGYTDATVPAKPVLLWTYKERHAPKTAWAEPYGELSFIDFDYADQVTVGAGRVYFGSSADHTIRGLDIDSGDEQWVFYTEGPVRFAPVLHKNRLCAVSDDGYLYCLKATNGSLLWKRRLAPGRQRCFGNGQMISKWPCRSGVLIEGDKLYATTGMWSGDGVIIYCLNADSGEVIWKNDTTGYRWMLLPHGSGYGGVSPQGYLAFYKETLYVAAGRSAPAIFDARTGKLLFHEIGLGYKAHYPGGSWIMAAHDWIMFKRQHNYRDTDVKNTEYQLGRNSEGIILYNYRTGNPEIATVGGRVIGAAVEDDLVLAGAGSVIRINANELRDAYKTHKQRGKQKGGPKYYDPAPLAKWNTDIGRVYTLMIAGDKIVAGGKGTVTLLDAKSGEKLWRRNVDGSVRGLSVSKGAFIATTTSGRIYCFGKGDSDSAKVVSHKQSAPAGTADVSSKVIKEIGVTEGYCLMLGAGDGSLLFDLLKQTKLTVYCLEPDAAKRRRIRTLLDEAGMLGVRAQLHDGAFDSIPYAPYSGNCILWGARLGSRADKIDFKGLYRSLRPWGGVACEFGDRSSTSASRSRLVAGGVPAKEISDGAFGTMVRRGPLPGAGQWTRGHANPGNTFSSGDDLVKSPLGILWWGGVGPERIVSRHWRAPVPLFSKGHMFIQGQHDIIGVDAYTGREMWNRHIKDIGRFPPALRGGNIITDGDRVYCVKGLTCYALDARTGRTVQEYVHKLTPEQKAEVARLIPLHGVLSKKAQSGKFALRNPSVVWEFLGMAGNRMIGTLGYDASNLKHNGLAVPHQSRYIFAYDKITGAKAWEIKLNKTVMPTAIVSDDQHLYFIDRTDEWTYLSIRRRKGYKGFSSKLKAVRLSDGETVWTHDNLKPQRKALLLGNGVLVASANFSDSLGDSTSGLSAFSARDGGILWERDRIRATKRRGGPVRHLFIVGDTLYTPSAVDLKTGKEKLVGKDPLTGKPTQFQLSGQNFCGSIAAGNHILAYRSTGLGFKSLTDNSPYYWLSEKRTSCWISLLPVGGILLAPEGSSTCVCSFNYKTSLALIPVQRHESWGLYLKGAELAQGTGSSWKGAEKIVGRPVDFHQLRLNLNAPGDHYDKTDGGNFLAWPQATRSGKGFITVPVKGADGAAGFRLNSDFTPITGTARPWIYSSGLTGEIKLEIMGTQQKKYRVVLHFMEPEQVRKGQRVFDVLINGKKALTQLDIVGEAGGPNKAIVKEVRSIAPCTTVEISLKRVSGKPPLICGIEIIPGS